QILIYGDNDADGMTSASILKETLEELGAEVQVYLPNRFTDGYGPNQSVYKYFIEQQGISLIVTVDNGVAGHEAIAYAKEMGVDVIVTDHHSMQETLPNAYAIVHPEHPEGNYPFKHLAGCGVAFKLACALLENVHADLLDLVAIGTIADMV
ncbi:DHH family phosphoesterase, partial [Streptococcus suis]|uniref:DHH family phosphoesterase n=1 Tax=Streptococcus suis TaxID=1307 RepID=UPI0018761F17